MNWYFKIILAQSSGLSGYLKRLGASSDIIQFIISQEKNYAQFLTNEFRKNPSLTLQQLQIIQLPQKIDPYLPDEKTIARVYPGLEKWILITFRKIRKGKDPRYLRKDPRLYSLLDVLTYEELLSHRLFLKAQLILLLH